MAAGPVRRFAASRGAEHVEVGMRAFCRAGTKRCARAFSPISGPSRESGCRRLGRTFRAERGGGPTMIRSIASSRGGGDWFGGWSASACATLEKPFAFRAWPCFAMNVRVLQSSQRFAVRFLAPAAGVLLVILVFGIPTPEPSRESSREHCGSLWSHVPTAVLGVVRRMQGAMARPEDVRGVNGGC